MRLGVDCKVCGRAKFWQGGRATRLPFWIKIRESASLCEVAPQFHPKWNPTCFLILKRQEHSKNMSKTQATCVPAADCTAWPPLLIRTCSHLQLHFNKSLTANLALPT